MKGPTLLMCLLAVLTVFGSDATNTDDRPSVIVVVGASGDEEYGKTFEKCAKLWEQASREGGAKYRRVGGTNTNATVADSDQLKQILAAEPTEGTGELWLVLIGHGTFDGKEAKFNLRGPDLSVEALADWLKPFRRPLAIIDCSSSSAPFLNKLSATNRVIVTATRSGYEQNYARFGEYVSGAIADPRADLDKDGQTSLLEAFLTASRRVAEFYSTSGRLATEHALLDDNGDGLGTPADWFRGIHAVKKAKEGVSADGFRAHQFHVVRSEQERKMPSDVRARRDELELVIARLRDMKSGMKEADYYQQLEKLFTELAALYEQGAPKPR